MAKKTSGKSLVILESPAKAKTIGKFLGSGFVVKSSIGHVRDLVSKGRGQERFGIDFENGYKPRYEIIKGKEKVLADLATAAKKADTIYLAPDPDREGEAIAWHLAEALSLPAAKTRRISFNAITKSEVSKAMAAPGKIDMNLVNAQQARRVLDRLVGFSLSPLLWKKVCMGLSAGRVQSVAVRMVVELEKEIAAFVPEDFWRITATLSQQGKTAAADCFLALMVSWQDRKFAESSLLKPKDILKWPEFIQKLNQVMKQDTFVARLQSLLPDKIRKLLGEIPAGDKANNEFQLILIKELNEALKNRALFTPAACQGLEIDSKLQPFFEELASEEVTGSQVIELNRFLLEAALPEFIAPAELRLSLEGQSQDIIAQLAGKDFTVTDLVERKISTKPNPAFITSTLQRAASTFLGMRPSSAMRIAQQLYEGVDIGGGPVGLITYMRTDSVRTAPEAVEEARAYIGKHYAKQYLCAKPNYYSSKNSAQDAHEAIRPTHVEYSPAEIKSHLTRDQFRLYDLIWRRFVATQMANAEYLNTTATISAGEGIFQAKGHKIVFDGYTKVWGFSKTEDQILPSIQKGEVLSLHDLSASHHTTKPPARYSEASLVKALESEGIGRPSTYAAIVKTIQDRGYVRLEKRAFYATELGIGVTDLLLLGFPEIMDYKFTAGMEDDLDHVAEGRVDWVKMIDTFYKPFEAKLEVAADSLEPLKNKPAPDGQRCPKCEGAMLVKFSKSGAFLSCENYPECKGTRPLDVQEAQNEEGETIACPECGGAMLEKRSRFGVYLACSNYPDCKKTMSLGKDGKVVKLPEIQLDCEECGKPMAVKMGRRGPFVACTGYPECKNTKPLDKDGNPVNLPKITGTCEKCGGEMIVRSSRRGPFLGCTGYPKCRNAKPIPADAQEGDHIDFSTLTSEELEALQPKKKAKKAVKKKAKAKSKKKIAKKTVKKKVAKKRTKE
ncbi:MAG: type I DNA topoisomerase [Planctomycetes bacterium]|nr:type I DNA topoisomerase [Planctomycetota bacterium]